MTNEEMQALTDRIQEKVGKEGSGLIADDIAMLISDTNKVNQSTNDLNDEILKLKEQKERLIETNGNLLQQISMGEDIVKKTPTKEIEDEEVSISWSDCFDSKRELH